MNALLRCLAMLAVALLSLSAQAQASNASERVWDFKVLLDDREIGHHRFTLTELGNGQRRLQGEAAFDVKFLFVNAYRYRHSVTENWSGDCLQSLTSRTDDDGKPLKVSTERQGNLMTVTGPKGTAQVEGCVMSYAYWNPVQLQKQTRLLNPQTGELDAVQFSTVGNETWPSRGEQVPARRIRLSGPTAPVDILLSPSGEWLGLESLVAGKRRLRYLLP